MGSQMTGQVSVRQGHDRVSRRLRTAVGCRMVPFNPGRWRLSLMSRRTRRYSPGLLLLSVTFLIVLLPGYCPAERTQATVVLPPAAVDKPKPGIFLVASRDLRDPNFAESVILLTDQGPNGTMGLIVNKPTPMTVAAALPEINALHENQDPILLGGPVSINSVRLLVRSASTLPDGISIIDGVYLVNNAAILESLLDEKPTDTMINFYAGYTGWAPGQLEFEINRGDWHLAEANSAAIFTTDRASVWRELIEYSAGRWVDNSGLRPGTTRFSREGECGSVKPFTKLAC